MTNANETAALEKAQQGIVTPELRRMAALSRITPMGDRDSKGRLLPARYRTAERLLASLV